jgi:hypothetical protein
MNTNSSQHSLLLPVHSFKGDGIYLQSTGFWFYILLFLFARCRQQQFQPGLSRPACRPTYQDSQPAVSTAKLPWIQDRNISYSLLKKGLLYKKDKSTTTAICHQR